ncbi:hypothetical protein TRIUR3_14951 [Triticum urartu]|uniref:Uncharacterized protein n=1 Tax=Triticum urartu TaxID=4572 RepID=M8AHL1_TRIUA|nr:hypothetical protein TRIUR3_14951 [Triticum urartu]
MAPTSPTAWSSTPTLHQVAGGALLLLSLSKGTEINKFAVLSLAAGLLAILLGEFGRRRTVAVFLRLYTSLSSIAIAFSVTCIIRSDLFVKITKQNTAAITSYEMFDVVRVALASPRIRRKTAREALQLKWTRPIGHALVGYQKLDKFYHKRYQDTKNEA